MSSNFDLISELDALAADMAVLHRRFASLKSRILRQSLEGPSEPGDEEWITAARACKLLGLSPRSLYDWRKSHIEGVHWRTIPGKSRTSYRYAHAAILAELNRSLPHAYTHTIPTPAGDRAPDRRNQGHDRGILPNGRRSRKRNAS